jgi:hypothetical protein
MKSRKIHTEQIASMTVSSLPARPSAPKELGGRGYTATDIKAAFDRLPLFLVERYNELIEDLEAVGENSLAAAMKTGIKESHTLADLFEDVKSGALASYMMVGGASLEYAIASLNERLRRIEEVIK